MSACARCTAASCTVWLLSHLPNERLPSGHLHRRASRRHRGALRRGDAGPHERARAEREHSRHFETNEERDDSKCEQVLAGGFAAGFASSSSQQASLEALPPRALSAEPSAAAPDSLT